MVYGRRYRRTRRGRRTGRRLSTRRIVGRTGARAQASQILALRNQQRRMWRALRPEMVPFYNNGFINLRTTTEQTTPSLGYGVIGNDIVWANQNISGDKVRFKKVEIYAQLSYLAQNSANNIQAAGRIIVLYPKRDIQYDDLEEYRVVESDANTLNMLNGPLVSNITDQFQVLRDVRFSASSTQGIKNIRVPMYMNKVVNVSDITQDETIVKNQPIVWMFLASAAPSTNFTFVSSYKLFWTDV